MGQKMKVDVQCVFSTTASDDLVTLPEVVQTLPLECQQGDTMTPEQLARVNIDKLLQQAGWYVCNMADANIHAARGVALREFPLNPGYGFADYLLYIDGKAAGVIEAKKEGSTLTGVEVQSARYARPCRICISPARDAGSLAERLALSRLGIGGSGAYGL
jgi:hypothetical protein